MLAEYPDPPYVTKQFSSYDRASEAPGKESWFANADRGFMLYDGVVKEKTPYFKNGPHADAAGRRLLRRRHEGRHRADAQADRRVTSGPTPRRGRPAPSTARSRRATSHEGRDAGPAGPRPGRNGRPRLRGPHLVGQPNDAGKIRIYLDEAKSR